MRPSAERIRMRAPPCNPSILTTPALVGHQSHLNCIRRQTCRRGLVQTVAILCKDFTKCLFNPVVTWVSRELAGSVFDSSVAEVIASSLVRTSRCAYVFQNVSVALELHPESITVNSPVQSKSPSKLHAKAKRHRPTRHQLRGCRPRWSHSS